MSAPHKCDLLAVLNGTRIVTDGVVLHAQTDLVVCRRTTFYNSLPTHVLPYYVVHTYIAAGQTETAVAERRRIAAQCGKVGSGSLARFEE